MKPEKKSTRRTMLAQATAAVGAMSFPYIVPASVLGKDGAVAPSNRIVMGAIGVSGQGTGNMRNLMKREGVQFVAVCDVETKHRDRVRGVVNEKNGNEDCTAYKDFRALVARKDIDAVCIGTPDHWHALTSVAALDSGKDVYCEKPLANSIAEGRAICDAVERNDRVLQTGSQERSGSNARFACELVRSGRIGRLHTIRINLPCTDRHHNQVRERNKVEQPISDPPEGFDYDFWLVHTPKVPYTSGRCHFWWRFILAHGGGEMTDRGTHVIDIAQLGNGTDHTGPVEITAKGTHSTTGLYDAFMSYEFENVYVNGVRMIGSDKGARGLKFEGTEGVDLYPHPRRQARGRPRVAARCEAHGLRRQPGPKPGASPGLHQRRPEPQATGRPRGDRPSNGIHLPPQQHRDDHRP